MTRRSIVGFVAVLPAAAQRSLLSVPEAFHSGTKLTACRTCSRFGGLTLQDEYQVHDPGECLAEEVAVRELERTFDWYNGVWRERRVIARPLASSINTDGHCKYWAQKPEKDGTDQEKSG